LQCVVVIFDHQDTQALAWIIRSPRSLVAHVFRTPRSPITEFCAASTEFRYKPVFVILNEAKLQRSGRSPRGQAFNL
jgi:hypothetical protein